MSATRKAAESLLGGCNRPLRITGLNVFSSPRVNMCADEKNDLRICTSWKLSAYMGWSDVFVATRAPTLQAMQASAR